MARKAQQSGGDGPPGPGLWIVTFSDCMTLLLCFFVMLVSFSSFDESSLDKVAGAFATPGHRSMSECRHVPRDSVVTPKVRQVDHTEAGSDMPTDEPPRPVQNPRRPLPALGAEAYKDKQVFYVSSERLFWGNGSNLRGPGKGLLQMVANFMKLVPCDAVVGELPGASEGHEARLAAAHRGLNRSLSAVQYLSTRQGLSTGRLHVSACDGVAPGRFGGGPVLVVSLFARRAGR